VIAVCNATVGIEILLKVLGLTGEVLVPAFTFVATAHSVDWTGLTPVFVDIDKATHNMDIEDAARKVTRQTSAVMPVHLWGEPCRPRDFETFAARHGLSLVFDSAHAFSCESEGIRVASFGSAEIFSFHATKVFNSFEGGAITTNDADLAKALRLAVNFGFSGVDQVASMGTNGKMTEICAAMGLCQLETLDTTLAKNRSNQAVYAQKLAGVPGIQFRPDCASERRNYQYCVAEVSQWRDQLLKVLIAENVLARRYFYPGVHKMEPYVSRDPQLKMPGAEAVASRILVLPTGTAVSEEDVARVAEIIYLALSEPDRLANL